MKIEHVTVSCSYFFSSVAPAHPVMALILTGGGQRCSTHTHATHTVTLHVTLRRSMKFSHNIKERRSFSLHNMKGIQNTVTAYFM